MNAIFKTEGVVFTAGSLREAEAFQGGKPKYGGRFDFPANYDLNALRALIDEVGVAKFGPKFKDLVAKGQLKTMLRESTTGSFFMNIKSERKPLLLSNIRNPATGNPSELEDIPRDSLVRVSFDVYASNSTPGNNGVFVNLRNVMMLKAGASVPDFEATEDAEVSAEKFEG